MSRLKGFLTFVNTHLKYIQRRFIKPASGILKNVFRECAGSVSFVSYSAVRGGGSGFLVLGPGCSHLSPPEPPVATHTQAGNNIFMGRGGTDRGREDYKIQIDI